MIDNKEYKNEYQSESFLNIKSSEIKIILIGRINKQKNILGAIKGIIFLLKF